MGRKSFIEKGLVSYETLYELYVVQSLSVQAISKKLGVSTGVVHKYLKHYNIPRRSRGNRLSKPADSYVVDFSNPQHRKEVGEIVDRELKKLEEEETNE
jgi:transposase